MRDISFLGVIPARGGSKGVPRKNIKMIAGKPLLAWSIEAAKKSSLLNKVIVSTEDPEVAEVARCYGAEVLMRPPELATDEASTLSVLQHVLANIDCKAIVLLQPTSPNRSDGLIDKCIKKFKDNDYDSIATGFICKYIEYGKNSLRRQEIEGFFYDDGNVYVIDSAMIRKGDRYGKMIGRKVITRWENVEIDDEFDFWVTEQILLKKAKR